LSFVLLLLLVGSVRVRKRVRVKRKRKRMVVVETTTLWKLNVLAFTVYLAPNLRRVRVL